MAGVLTPSGERFILDHEAFAAWAATIDWQNAALLAQNTQFDGRILSHVYNVFPRYTADTQSMARAAHGFEEAASLKVLMEKYNVGVKGTTVADMIGRRANTLSAVEFRTYANYCINDVDGTAAVFQRMLTNGFPEAELDLIDMTVRMYTEPVLVLDEAKLAAFHAEEQRRKDEMLAALQIDPGALRSDAQFAEILTSLGVEVPMKWSAAQKKEVPAFAKSDPGMQGLLEYDDGDEARSALVQGLAQARLAHKSTINVSRAERLLRLGYAGAAMPVFLKYVGAHTTRWSGGDKMNWQNFERANKKNPRKGMIRKCIMAPPGMTLVVGDASQIEARMLGWNAGQADLMEAFREGRDVYSERASLIYGRKVDRKNVAADEIPGFVGKVATLGLGYGMGWNKFGRTLLAGAMGGPPVVFTRADADAIGVNVQEFLNGARGERAAQVDAIPTRIQSREEKQVHFAVAAHIVNTYRRTHKDIVAFWEVCEEIIGMMMSQPEGQETDLAPLTIVRHGYRLPSGLTMHYQDLHLDDSGQYVHKTRKGYQKLYGGLVAENITQALSRVALGEHMLQMQNDCGYKIVMSTHDEMVAAVPVQVADIALADMKRIMTTSPKWAPDLPLAMEGSHNPVYGLAK